MSEILVLFIVSEQLVVSMPVREKRGNGEREERRKDTEERERLTTNSLSNESNYI